MRSVFNVKRLLTILALAVYASSCCASDEIVIRPAMCEADIEGALSLTDEIWRDIYEKFLSAQEYRELQRGRPFKFESGASFGLGGTLFVAEDLQRRGSIIACVFVQPAAVGARFIVEEFHKYLNGERDASLDDELIANLQLGVAASLAKSYSRAVYITRLYVTSSARGKQLGERMLDAVERHYRDISALYLDVYTSNARAHSFYERLEYERLGKIYCGQSGEKVVYCRRLMAESPSCWCAAPYQELAEDSPLVAVSASGTEKRGNLMAKL